MAIEYLYSLFADGTLAKLDPDGQLLWRFDVSTIFGESITGVADQTGVPEGTVDAAGNYYFAAESPTGRKVYGVDPSGAAVFTSPVLSNINPTTDVHLGISSEGTNALFVGTKRDPFGSTEPPKVQKYVGGVLDWEYSSPDSSVEHLAFVTAAPDGGAYVALQYEGASTDGVLRLDANGDEVWTVPVTTAGKVLVAPDGSVYVPPGFRSGEQVKKLDPASGTVLYSEPVPNLGGTNTARVSTYGQDGFIYRHDNYGINHKIDPADGSVVAAITHSSEPVYTGIEVDENGFIYASEQIYTDGVRKIDQSGGQVWQYGTGDTFRLRAYFGGSIPPPEPEPVSDFWRNFVNTREILEP